MARLRNVAPELRTAVSKAERGLTVAQREGFHGIEGRMREAVLASERFADDLVRLSQQGLRPRAAAGQPVTAADIEAAVSAVRNAIGALALTRPSVVSSHFEAYAGSVRALVELADEALKRGVEAAQKEKDEWDLFR